VVNLDPLDHDAGSELLTSLLGAAPSPEVRDLLLERSGGNPFFLEELVALLGTRTPAEVAAIEPLAGHDFVLRELPDALRGLVAARLDALPPDERAVLADAAVLGRRYPVVALKRMALAMGRSEDLVDQALPALVANEMLELEDGWWAFRSDLVREVAYGTITKQDRAKRHYGIATWIEANHHGPWSDVDIDRMGHHLGVAAELVAELGRDDVVPADVVERAVKWLAEAAARAEADDALVVARHLYDRAITLTGPVGDARLRLLLGRSRVRSECWELDGARADAEEAAALAAKLDDQLAAAEAGLRLGIATHRAGATETGRRLLSEAALAYEAVGERDGRAEALRQLGMAQLFEGDFAAAERSVLTALDAFEDVGSLRGQAWASQNLAWISFVTGDVEVAEQRLERSLSGFAELGDNVGTAWCVGLLGFVKLQLGLPNEAEALAQNVLEDARARHDHWAMSTMQVLLSVIRLWSGRTDEAVQLAGEALEVFERLGDSFAISLAIGPYARGLVMSGRVEEGLERFERVTAGSATGTGDVPTTPTDKVALAATLVHLGDPEQALELAEELIRTSPVGLGGGDCAVSAALAHLQLGQAAAAAGVLDRLGPPEAARPYARSVRALVAAALGHRAEAADIAVDLPTRPASTYLDLIYAEVAASLAAARERDEAEAHRWLNRARDRADATGDRVTQALVRVAETTARRVLADPEAEAAAIAARDRLDALAVDLRGWTTAFGLATGTAATSR
jgi:tetratricopeptide (TPR) repeat protein